MDNKEGNSLLPPSYASAITNSSPLNNLLTPIAKTSDLSQQATAKRKFGPREGAQEDQRPTKRECYSRPLEIVPGPQSYDPMSVQILSQQQFKGGEEKQVTTEVPSYSKSFFNCARSIKGYERYKAAAYIAELVLR
ncbi:MAG: hypothetical protein K0M45_05645 [Candidatus Paracaedibacteraceae bacterium]|nr:hypothetical protein [Candidatus Paracaedibacteraceae bacterium]